MSMVLSPKRKPLTTIGLPYIRLQSVIEITSIYENYVSVHLYYNKNLGVAMRPPGGYTPIVAEATTGKLYIK